MKDQVVQAIVACILDDGKAVACVAVDKVGVVAS